MADALRMARAWGAALGDLDPVPEERLAALLQTCAAAQQPGQRPENAGELLQKLLPLLAFLEAPNGRRHADAVVPQLVELLDRLPSVWLAPHQGVLQAQADCTQLMASARRLVGSPAALPPGLQQQLSSALRRALSGLFEAALEHQARAAADAAAAPRIDPAWAASGANLLLRAVTREEPFASGAPLPLLPEDAAALLASLAPRAPPPPPPSRAPSANGAAPQPRRSSADGGGGRKQKQGGAQAQAAAAAQAQAQLPALLRDDKIYLLVSKLVATAAPSPSVRGGAALTPLLGWSSGAVRHALEALVRPAGADVARGAPPTLEATYAAADLANACVSLLMEAAKPGAGPAGGGGGGGELPADVMRLVDDLLEVALSVAEAALAVSDAAPADPDNSRVLGMAGRILAGCVAFVAAAARASADAAAATVARLHELLLETAHVMAAADAAAGAGGGGAAAAAVPPAAAGGRASATLRRILSDRHHARRERGSGRSGGGAAAAAADLSQTSQRRLFRRPGSAAVVPGGAANGGLETPLPTLAAAAAGAAPAAPPGFVAELSCPWCWDVTQPLTLLSDGTPLRLVPLSAGLGAARLLRSVMELLSEALAAAWASGSRSGVNVLLVARPSSAGWHEHAAEALTLARLYARLGADPDLGALAVPVLSDPLVGGAIDALSGAPRPPPRGGGGGDPAAAAAARAPAPEVAGALVNALEGMACACAQARGGGEAAWTYDQALKLLLKLYREPSASTSMPAPS
ncbi:hypothetical protein Rsub_04997 [Raphidocelis subcapitata]|uniref:Uncharacterized protein n=1 Tax=Raphidocelis subcapitata TaxID=307507 RepID=A0A2V0NYY8_9CHLO|nr:hypothetical protein Rsub_04997 [Raphidocelis subcapitata]|eukprot:GBF91892.1 hypothetical protein Rsub_04997 [Raphidocelis subcapitata]